MGILSHSALLNRTSVSPIEVVQALHLRCSIFHFNKTGGFGNQNCKRYTQVSFLYHLINSWNWNYSSGIVWSIQTKNLADSQSFSIMRCFARCPQSIFIKLQNTIKFQVISHNNPQLSLYYVSFLTMDPLEPTEATLGSSYRGVSQIFDQRTDRNSGSALLISKILGVSIDTPDTPLTSKLVYFSHIWSSNLVLTDICTVDDFNNKPPMLS